MLGWDVRSGRLIEADIAVVGMPFYNSVFFPSDQSAVGDAEFCTSLCLCQHSPVAQPVVARPQPILFDEINDAQVGERGAGPITPR